MLLSITSSTWIVTGLGFGIVLALLFCLVFILMFFGCIMQKATAPKEPKDSTKPATVQEPAKEEPTVNDQLPMTNDQSADIAAVAYALYLMQNDNSKHDLPTAMISLHKHETAWNEKSIGLNNVGF